MPKERKATQDVRIKETAGDAGEVHQQNAVDPPLSTNQGLAISDDQNSLRAGDRGPTLLEDFVLREKITHFDHERIPERVVHVRGFGVHGFFQCYKSLKKWCRAAFLQDPQLQTPVFVRFSTVAGSEGSPDTARDVRGFAVKFYTQEGNFDLVGNNIPVFFIQDAIKFPDLIHAVKPEPDRGFPQAATAHDTFWDFMSLMPESIHMQMWIMSDRTIPRSFRMMEGFGVHTFRLVNSAGESTFVKFHWRPTIGSASLVWDEAVKLAGADIDFHRRDLWNAIQAGDFPEFELGLQLFDQKTADSFDFDILDPTKIIPEELIPLQMVGKMVLNRTVDNFFDETEQVAFCPANIVRGIEFSDDPLLQGRLFSYLDTQLTRLGSPNFHEIPINAPKCPFRNLQRDGHMRTTVDKGRITYEPNSLDPAGPREDARRGFQTFAAETTGTKQRPRSETFADHYTQARLFYLSMTEPERNHIVSAFAFELAKVQTVAVRQRMLGHLKIVDAKLSERVATALGMEGQATRLEPAVPLKKKIEASPALSLIAKAAKTLQGRKLGVLLSDGAPARSLDALRKAAKAEGAMLEAVTPRIGGVKLDNGEKIVGDHAVFGGPSILFDAVAVLTSTEGGQELAQDAAAVDWVRDAFGHLKVIAYTPTAGPLFEKAGVPLEDQPGVIDVQNGRSSIQEFVDQAKGHRIWDREPKIRPVY